jgi:signal transduction histidine kinase
MRRLHIQFYLAILATLLVFALCSAVFLGVAGNVHVAPTGPEYAARLAQRLLPPAAAPVEQQLDTMRDLQEALGTDMALYDRGGRLIGATANMPAVSSSQFSSGGWAFVHGNAFWVLPLQDGRRLIVRHHSMGHSVGWHVFIVPLAIVVAFALGAYPIARRLTRRLARLQSGVEQLGRGDLTARVAVEGRDEVAALARSFNQSAERIGELMQAQKLLLANCSHELRTPLARIRLGIERLADGGDGTTRAELARSIAELDALIGEMLLASRLDALKTLDRTEDLDLLALAAEEAAYFDRSVEGRPVTVRGDPALLRRLIRNLLDNARRHGGGATRVSVTESAGRAELVVEDQGAGVPAADREKIFEPFYRVETPRSTERGFGLGLSISRQIAHAHGGDISCQPAASGSRFVVTMPVVS